jgi:TPR repeat protein
LGCIYGYGLLWQDEEGSHEIVKPDHIKSIHYYERAAQLGDIRSHVNLAATYMYGLGDTPQDQPRAVGCYALAAAEKDPIGLFNLGIAYFYGTGIEQNFRVASDLFNLAEKYRAEDASLAISSMKHYGLYDPSPSAETSLSAGPM